MSEPALIIEQIGPVVRATLNRPDKLNAINSEIMGGLQEAIRTFARREDQKVFLIRSTGRYFSAGADVSGGGAPMPTANTGTAMRRWYRDDMGPGMQRMYNDMEEIEKPFVIAHHSTCIGGGLELSLSCDFRLAAKSARYVFPEWKLGSIPASGGVSRFTRLVGEHWAKWIIMADQPIAADRALTIGLVHDVYEDAEFDEKVMAFCNKIAAHPPEMMAVAKLTIQLAADASRGDGRQIERLGQSLLQIGQESHDLVRGIQERVLKGDAKA